MKYLTLIFLVLFIANFADAQNKVNKTFHPGDTVFPGSPEWIHAGSPRSSITGDSIILIWGTDGTLHPVVFETQNPTVNQVPRQSAPVGLVSHFKPFAGWVPTMVVDESEKQRLVVAVLEIKKNIPDRITRRMEPSIVKKEPKRDSFQTIMHWTDSIAQEYYDPEFMQIMEKYYRWPMKHRLDRTPFWTDFDHPRFRS